MPAAVWRNTKTGTEVAGLWDYHWPSGTFRVWLAKPVAFGGERRKQLSLLGYDTPEWGRWKLVREETP